MTTETLENGFAEVLSTIASGLGIAAERIFGIFVSAQVMIGILDIASIFLTLFGALFFGWYTRRWCKKWWIDDDGEWEDDESEAAGIWFPSFIVVTAAFVISIVTNVVSNAMVKMCYPEYTAMQEIIGLVIP